MDNKIVFCKSREGYTVKVGTFKRSEETGEWVFYKHKPYKMRVIGKSGGYGIQKEVFDENGKKYDLQEIFRKHPELEILIKDPQEGEVWTSNAKTWLDHQHAGNYGYGKQIFLSVDYMTHVTHS